MLERNISTINIPAVLINEHRLAYGRVRHFDGRIMIFLSTKAECYVQLLSYVNYFGNLLHVLKLLRSLNFILGKESYGWSIDKSTLSFGT
jgi:hypothetical protein